MKLALTGLVGQPSVLGWFTLLIKQKLLNVRKLSFQLQTYLGQGKLLKLNQQLAKTVPTVHQPKGGTGVLSTLDLVGLFSLQPLFAVFSRETVVHSKIMCVSKHLCMRTVWPQCPENLFMVYGDFRNTWIISASQEPLPASQFTPHPPYKRYVTSNNKHPKTPALVPWMWTSTENNFIFSLSVFNFKINMCGNLRQWEWGSGGRKKTGPN